MSGGFLGRWSQRKRDAQAGLLTPETSQKTAQKASQETSQEAHQALVPGAAAFAAPPSASVPAMPVAKAGLGSAFGDASWVDAAQPEAVLPTLADAAQLTPASDFQPFMSKGVASEIRNAAMKKLFTDPHFNIMDGLDIYIGDYNTPDPLPPEMLRQMVSAQFLGLWDDEVAAGDPVPGVPTAAPLADALSQVPTNTATNTATDTATNIPTDAAHAAATPSLHDHTDLRLQPNPASANPEPESGAG